MVWSAVSVALSSAGCGGPAAPPAVPEALRAEVPDGATRLDLVEYLPAASRSRERAAWRLDDPEARAAAVHGWGEVEREGDVPYAWGLGEGSSIDLFVARPRDLTLVLDGLAFTPPGAPPQRVSVIWNGTPVGDAGFGTRRARRRVSVPRAAVRTGANRLELRYAYHGRPADVVPGAGDQRPLAVRWFGLSIAGARDAPPARAETAGSTPLLELPASAQAAYHVVAEPGLFLAADDVRLRDGATLRVEMAWDDGEPHAFELGGSAGAGPWSWPLAAPEGALVRVSLTALPPVRGGPGRLVDRLRGARPAALLVRPRLVVAADAGGDRGTAAAPSPPARLPDVVLYAIDTLRADHLGTYGYARGTSPEIDRFATEATVFTEAEAQSSWTRTTMVSVLTGLEPERHRIAGRDDALPAAVETLAERLGALGYRRAAVVTNGNVAPTFGIDQGFEDYRYLRESQERPEMHVLADDVNREAFAMLGALAAAPAPFFLYLHASDPHAPYRPREPFRARFAPGVDPERGAIEQVHAISRGELEAPEGTREAFIDLYDAEIAFVDHHFGRLLDRLRATGRYDDTLVVVVADHGEEFGEHGGWEHGKTLYAEQLRVPLIVKFPRGWGAGRRIEGVARQIDIAPTVLAAAGLAPADLDGAPLQALLTEGGGSRFSRASLHLDERRMRSVVARGYKLIVDESVWVRNDRHELFAVAADPRERVNRYHEAPIPRGFLQQIDRGLRVEARRRGGLPAPERADVDPELRERLEALGYVN